MWDKIDAMRATFDPTSENVSAEQLEALRDISSQSNDVRAMLEEIGGQMPIVERPSEKVKVRIRCPETHQLLKLVFTVRFNEIYDIRKANVSVNCSLCPSTHLLSRENAVIVPYTDEEQERGTVEI
jgi:hypothetical protein